MMTCWHFGQIVTDARGKVLGIYSNRDHTPKGAIDVYNSRSGATTRYVAGDVRPQSTTDFGADHYVSALVEQAEWWLQDGDPWTPASISGQEQEDSRWSVDMLYDGSGYSVRDHIGYVLH